MKRALFVAACSVAAALAAPPSVLAETTDSLTGQQWGLEQVRAEQAWPVSTGAGVTIAIVDTGVDLTHPDLRANLVRGATFTGCHKQAPCGNGDWRGADGKADVSDVHGTHVAGIAAAVRDNGIGIAGVAPDAKIMPVKVLDAGVGTFGDVAAGIRWSVDNGADVINLSLGTLPGMQVLTVTGVLADVTDAISYATERGVEVVAAAGNEAASICSSPAFDAGAICVTATDSREMKAGYSNLGIKPDMTVVAAPGGAALGCENDIVSTVPVGQGFAEACGERDYDYFAGTSMASPHVSGVVALLRSAGVPAGEVADRLTSTARTPGVGTGTFTPIYGWGIVDAEAAVVGHVTIAGQTERSWIGSLMGFLG